MSERKGNEVMTATECFDKAADAIQKGLYKRAEAWRHLGETIVRRDAGLR